MNRGGLIAGLVIAIFLIWVFFGHIIPAELSKNTIPATCQLFGGQWNIWSGWKCG